MSNARSTLVRELAQDLFREGYLEFTALSNSDSSTTVVPATELRSTGSSSYNYSNGWLYVYGGTSANDERRIYSYNGTANTTYGTITTDRPLTAQLDATSTCFVYNGPLSVTDLKRLLNKGLRRLRRQRILPLTLITDGLMETSGTSSWTASSSSLAKSTTAGNIVEGTQALTVTNSGANGEARSTSVNCIPGETMNIEAVVRVNNTTGTHTATLAAYDVTNSADIATLDTTNRERTRLSLTFVIPTGCYQFQARLRGSAATTVTHWDEVLLWRPNDKQFALPSDLDRYDQVSAVYQRIPLAESPSGGGGIEAPYASGLSLVPGWKVIADPTGATPFMLDVSRCQWSTTLPLLVDCLLPYAELSTDAATTVAPLDDIILRARALAYAQLAKDGPHEDRDYYAKLAQQLGQTWALASNYQPRPARPINTRPALPRAPFGARWSGW